MTDDGWTEENDVLRGRVWGTQQNRVCRVAEGRYEQHGQKAAVEYAWKDGFREGYWAAQDQGGKEE